MGEADKNMKMAKGTILLDYVRAIRSRKDIPWDKYLTKEDLEIINGKIFPTGWYPFETFRHCGQFVLHEIAKDDFNVVRMFGKFSMKNLIDKTYHTLAQVKDVHEALEHLNNIRNRFFNFTGPVSEKLGPQSIRVYLENDPNEPELHAFCYQIVGSYECIIELHGGRNVNFTWEKQVWRGDKSTSFIITWE